MEYVKERGRVRGCSYIDKAGAIVVKRIGECITADELFQSEEEMLKYCKGGETDEY